MRRAYRSGAARAQDFRALRPYIRGAADWAEFKGRRMVHGDDEHDFDGGGFDIDDWSRLSAFRGAVATLDDVQAGRAVFALGETEDPRPIVMELPQPLIWWDEDGEQGAVAVQAERHTGPDGESMDVLGLILPDGSSAVALLEDVDLVDDTDPTWRDLVTRAIDDVDAD